MELRVLAPLLPGIILPEEVQRLRCLLASRMGMDPNEVVLVCQWDGPWSGALPAHVPATEDVHIIVSAWKQNNSAKCGAYKQHETRKTPAHGHRLGAAGAAPERRSITNEVR